MKWRFPREGTAWAICQTCWQDYPCWEVWLNPRYGWQCHKCWDGLIQRDQIQQPVFPGEGTRKTLAPITNTVSEGVSATDSLITLYDHTLGYNVRYDMQFGQFITFGPSTSGNSPWGGILMNWPWVFYIDNGFASFGSWPTFPEAFPWPGQGTLQVDSAGFLEYIPYVQPIVS